MSQASFFRSSCIMSEPKPARIRAYKPSDEKPVRFMVGHAQMEPLAYANNRSTLPSFPSSEPISNTMPHFQRTSIP